MKTSDAEILREYGPFPDVAKVNGVTFDGRDVWFASGDRLNALDPESGAITRSIDVAAHAGTAFDGTHLFQIAEALILKIDPRTGQVLSSIAAPASGGDSGLAWPKARSGWATTAARGSIRSIQTRAPCCAPSSRTASSRA